jgi:hypothetical protein
VSRPSFQFYPADWRNNAKLRRCSWAARGVWIELIGLMHDSDNYGVLRWNLKQIAQALGAPIKLLKELVDNGVLYGVENGACAPFVYTPHSGRKDGTPVELIPAMTGPVWFSPRMVRDEYLRTVRGANTRFGCGVNPSPSRRQGEHEGDTPKPAPSRNESDGASSSSSSSSTTTVATATSVDARQRFEIFEGWQPDQLSLNAQLRMQGVPNDAITDAVLAEFVAFWITRSVADSQGGWCNRLVKRAKDLAVREAAEARPQPESEDWAAAGVVL